MVRLSSVYRNLLCSALVLGMGGVAGAAAAQGIDPARAAGGTLVVVPASATVRQANDRAMLLFVAEEQNRDKTLAASAVNRKMKDGIELIRRADPHAVLRTRAYATYPIYPEEPPVPAGGRRKVPVPVGWRVSQSVEVTTSDLPGLARMAAAAQAVLALDGINFTLSEAAARKLDEQRIAATYKNLTERMAAIARAMGRDVQNATIESLDFDGAGREPQFAPMMAMARRAKSEAAPVEETSFEPGETALDMHVVGKIRFK